MNDSIVIVYGAQWCGDCRRTKRFLDAHAIAYKWVDTGADEHALEYVQRVQGGGLSIPVVALPDGRHLIEPTDRELAEALDVPWPS